MLWEHNLVGCTGGAQVRFENTLISFYIHEVVSLGPVASREVRM